MRNVAEQLAGTAAVVQINTAENQALAARFAVRGIPLLVLLRDGRELARLAGAQPVEAVLAWFRRSVGGREP